MRGFRKKEQPTEPGTQLVTLDQPVQQAPPPRQHYDFSDLVWRCSCGSMGTSRKSAADHCARSHGRCHPRDIREYVPAEVYEEAFSESSFSVAASSGVWIVLQLPVHTPEGSIALNRFTTKMDWAVAVISADSGLQAIQEWYRERVEARTAGERDREDARYVAIDFFTGIRAEAEVRAEWRANVNVAEGSDGL